MAPWSASQMRVAVSIKASKTVCKSNADLLITLSTFAVAVCCCKDSVKSRVRVCTSSNKRTFSIAITAYRFAFLTNNGSHIRIAKSRCGLGERVKHRLQIKGRSTDDLKYIGGRRLLLQRLVQLIEQPRVLDGDNGLRGERFNKFDLLRAVWPRLGTLKP